MARSNPAVVAVQIVFIALLQLVGPGSASGGLFDFVPELGTLCAAVTGIPAIATCTQDFERDMTEYSKAYNENKQSADGEIRIPQFTLCCAVNKLESCISNQIGSVCGSNAESATKALVKTVLATAKFLTNQVSADGHIDCDWDHFVYRKESPLCWAPPIQILAGIVIVGILLICCCCSCCKKLCCRNKAQPIVVTIPFTSNGITGSGPQYRRFDKSEV